MTLGSTLLAWAPTPNGSLGEKLTSQISGTEEQIPCTMGGEGMPESLPRGNAHTETLSTEAHHDLHCRMLSQFLKAGERDIVT